MCLSCQQSTFWQWSLIFGYDSSPLRKVYDRSHVAQKKLVVWYSSMCSYLKCYYFLILKHILSSDNQSLMVTFLGWIWQQILNKYWPFYLQDFIFWVFKQNCKKSWQAKTQQEGKRFVSNEQYLDHPLVPAASLSTVCLEDSQCMSSVTYYLAPYNDLRVYRTELFSAIWFNYWDKRVVIKSFYNKC